MAESKMNKKAEEGEDMTDDGEYKYIIRYVGDYFNPDAEQEEFLNLSGEDDNARLEFWDELLEIIHNDPETYLADHEYTEDTRHDIEWEVLDDLINTNYSYPYEDLPDDEIGTLIKNKLGRINNDYAMMVEEEQDIIEERKQQNIEE
jgi:hypothetical protein